MARSGTASPTTKLPTTSAAASAPNTYRWLFWALIAVTAAGRLALALADYRSLIANDILQDDAFYYFKIAANVVAGRGLTFDGHVPTSGFQPLFLLLLLPVMKLAHSNPSAPIYVAGVLLAAFAIATGFLVHRLAERVAGARAALIALAVWALAPYFMVFGVNGQETGLALFLGAAIVLAYLRLKTASGASSRTALLLGLLSGLGVLARVDVAILLFAVGCDWGWSRWRHRSENLRMGQAAVAIGLAFVVWLPWGIVCKRATGDWLPLSGPANRLIALNYGWYSLPRVWSRESGVAATSMESRFFDPDSPPAAYWMDVATRAVFIFLYDQPLLGPLRANAPLRVWPHLKGYWPYQLYCAMPAVGTIVLASMLMGGAWFVRRRLRHIKGTYSAGELDSFCRILLVYLAVLLPAYTFYAPSHWYFSRYFTLPALLTLIAGVGIGALYGGPLYARGGWRRASVCIVVGVLIGWQAVNWRLFREVQWRPAPAGGFLASWEFFKPGVNTSMCFGAFQAGTISYFSGLDVVNLDGKVNPDAFRAIRERRLHEYLLQRGVQGIIDYDWVLYALCTRHAPTGAINIELLGREPHQPGCSIYSVSR